MSNAPLVKNQQSKSHNVNLDVSIDTWSEFTKVLRVPPGKNQAIEKI